MLLVVSRAIQTELNAWNEKAQKVIEFFHSLDIERLEVCLPCEL